MSKKTFNVADLTAMVNQMCAQSTCSRDIRQGAMNVLEQVLHSTGNYHGFRYLTSKDVPDGGKPGINIDDHVEILVGVGLRFADVDPTRVFYFSRTSAKK